jgi:hypothetical protein
MPHSTARRTYVANGVDAAAADVAGLDSERGAPVPLAGYSGERPVPAVRLRPATVSSGSSLCENAKVLGFPVSLYPSRVAGSPIPRDLKGRFFRTTHSACVFTQPRPTAARRGSLNVGAHCWLIVGPGSASSGHRRDDSRRSEGVCGERKPTPS